MDNETKHANSLADGPTQYRSLYEWARNSAIRGHEGEFPAGAEFPLELPADSISRRRFISLVSASAALALGTSCTRIDRGKIVPYTRRPAEVLPGVATYYASTFQEGLVTHGVLVKTREGRPIHIEGNPEYTCSHGKTSLRAMGDLLGLYDPDRLRAPSLNGTPTTWEKAEAEIAKTIQEAKAGSKPVLLLTEAVLSPTRKALIEEFKRALPALRHGAWEPAAAWAQFAAEKSLYGCVANPRLRFDRARVIVALQADFLGVHENAPAFLKEFAARRAIAKPTEPMNRLWAIEGGMTLTGANADQRLQVRPSKVAPLIFALARLLKESHGIPLPPGLSAADLKPFDLDIVSGDLGVAPGEVRALAEDLKQAGPSALVLAGPSLPPDAHIACQLLNSMLGAEGHTVDAGFTPPAPELLTVGELQRLLREAAEGKFAAAVFWGTNPAHSFPDVNLWKGAVNGIPMKIRIGLYEDETALECRWRLPEHHWLESWGDFQPSSDLLSLRQPTIGALHQTRQGEETILLCLTALGAETPRTYLEYLKSRWQREVYPEASPVPFSSYWNAALHDGVVRCDGDPHPLRIPRTEAFREAMISAVRANIAARDQGLELILQPATGIHDGRYANNGWLNELPDPVTKSTWGNPLLVSISDAERLGLKDEDVVRVTAGNRSVETPVVVQPGQAPGVLTLSLGYGRKTGSVANNVGVNAYALTDVEPSSPHLRLGVTIVRTGRRSAVPRTEEHQRMEGRDLARSWTVEEYAREIADVETDEGESDIASLMPRQTFAEHKWGMTIDLSACVGCNACVIACQSENNVPVVGPEQVLKGREMHWIRIDRYYEGDPRDPSIIHQPIPCQHCENAPCETVCPVNATTHSPDGLNQMTYNRCVGTRYCSNNCPFKCRRFNFFDYTSMKKAPENLVYNPEVTVRPRGVMEKCSFCVQRIQDVKERAKVEDRSIKDGEIRPACAVACPAEAIVFGDLHDPQSKVSRLFRANRGYFMLEELGVKPSVTYLTHISNPLRKGKA